MSVTYDVKRNQKNSTLDTNCKDWPSFNSEARLDTKSCHLCFKLIVRIGFIPEFLLQNWTPTQNSLKVKENNLYNAALCWRNLKRAHEKCASLHSPVLWKDASSNALRISEIGDDLLCASPKAGEIWMKIRFLYLLLYIYSHRLVWNQNFRLYIFLILWKKWPEGIALQLTHNCFELTLIGRI